MASPATRGSHIGYVPMPLCGIPAATRRPCRQFAMCRDAVPHTIVGYDVSRPMHARSAYGSIAYGKARVAADAIGLIIQYIILSRIAASLHGLVWIFSHAAMRHRAGGVPLSRSQRGWARRDGGTLLL